MAEALTSVNRLGSEADAGGARREIGRAEPPTPRAAATVEYPDNDGKPMESFRHYLAGMRAVTALMRYFGKAMHFGANNGVYYQEGDPKSVVVPDVYAVTGKRQSMEDVYLVWEHGLPPDFVLELASKTTSKRGKVVKRDIYAGIGVKDYFIFDPTGKYLDEPLLGFRLSKNSKSKNGKSKKPYKLVKPAPLADGGIAMRSKVLGLELRAWRGVDHPTLRFFDATTQRYLLSPEEACAAAGRQRQEVERQRIEDEQTIAALRLRLADLEARGES